MGNPLSKGPVGPIREEKVNQQFATQARRFGTSHFSEINKNTTEPVWNSLSVVPSLNCGSSNTPFEFIPQLGDNDLTGLNFKTQSKEFKNNIQTFPNMNVLDFTACKTQLGDRMGFNTDQKPKSNIIQNNRNVGVNIFPKDYLTDTSREKYTNFSGPTIDVCTKVKTLDDKIIEIKVCPFESYDRLPLSNPTRSNETIIRKEKRNVSTFFEYRPQMANKIRRQETKAAKRKREAAELAAMVEKRDKDDELRTSKPSDGDDHDYSDWEVPEDPFMKLYLGNDDSSVDSINKEEKKNKYKRTVNRPSNIVDSETDSEPVLPPKYQDYKERTRVAQEYKPSAKKTLKGLKLDGLTEPRRGKASLGRFEAYIAQRKKGHTHDQSKSGRPDFEIMDPGDGEDDWGAPRQLEPPPETVVVPWVPYGHKTVVAEDGTVTYTKPDTVYEKFTLTNLGNVSREPMSKEEIEEYIREEEEKKKKMLTEPPEPRASDGGESTDSALLRSEESDDYEVTWEEFEKADENENTVYGIPTNVQPYEETIEDENYLSDADEDKAFKLRPTTKKDLKYLGDIVQTFRIENPEKDQEPLVTFKFKTNDQEETIEENESAENKKRVDEKYDGYNDGKDENVESPDEYDDGISDAYKLIVYKDLDLSKEKYEISTHGLLRVEQNPYDSEDNIKNFELVLDDDDENYEDDQTEEDYDDDLKNVKLIRNFNKKHSLEKKEFRYNSDEDIDLSDESETYDSEEDDYEDNVKEDDYNDGNQLLDSHQDGDEELDTEDEMYAQFEKHFENDDPIARIKSLEEDVENIDPSLIDKIEQLENGNEDNDNDDEDEPFDEGQDSGPYLYDGYGNFSDSEEEETESESATESESESDYDGVNPSEYGDLDSAPMSDDDMIQDYNPVDLLNELEIQGDTFDDFPYSLENGTWMDFPYKHPGDAKEAAYDRGVPGKELPYWYFIKHPAEDDSLMNIRAKLADQYDHQTGPYNPFKVNPPPTPLWVDDTYDLVPKGVKVPDDFFYGFKNPDPDTLHKLQMEDTDDGYDDDDDRENNYGNDEDGRSWREMDEEEGPKRTWKPWKTRSYDETVRQSNERGYTRVRDLPEYSTNNQKIPKKNDQWQHYRDWLLRQGSKSIANQNNTNTNKIDSSKPFSSLSEGRFAGKRITERREENVQPRPHYQTWLTKQAEIKLDKSSSSSEVTKKPHEIQKTTHRNYEEAYVDDKWAETNHKPSENMWQHYQKWKQVDKNQTTRPDDRFVFSKPPEDVKIPHKAPYPKKDVDITNTNEKKNLKDELTALDYIKKTNSLNTLSPNTVTNSDINTSTLNNTVPRENVYPPNRYHPQHNLQIDLSSRTSIRSPPSGFTGTGNSTTSTSNDKFGSEAQFKPTMSFELVPNYFTGTILNRDSEVCSTPLSKRKTKINGFSNILRTHSIANTPTRRTKPIPRTKQKNTLNKIQLPEYPTYIFKFDDMLNIKCNNQLETTDNFTIDISKPQEISKDNVAVSASDEQSFNPTTSMAGSNDNTTDSHTTDEISTVKISSSHILETGNETKTPDGSKPKRVYTRRKKKILTGSKETTIVADSPGDQVVKKRKYTRRTKTPLVTNGIEIATDHSSHENNNQTSESTTEHPLRNQFSLDEEKTSDIVSSTVTTESSVTKHDSDTIDTNTASNTDSTETKIFVDELGENKDNDHVVKETVNSVHMESLPLKEDVKLTSLKVENPSQAIPFVPSSFPDKSKKSYPSKTQHHYKHYQTYNRKNTNEKHMKPIKPRQTYGFTEPRQSGSMDESKPLGYQSKVYPTIYSKPHGDHWSHYKAWLEKKGLQKILYKSPTARPVSISRPSYGFSNFQTAPTLDVATKTDAKPFSSDIAGLSMDEKVEYLHQRWLAWQQNLASKFVHKLNQMLKCYENPEGNINQDTTKVRDMIKQRDYWREIHRWSSRVGFTLYNKTPPQPQTTVLNLKPLQNNSIPQRDDSNLKPNDSNKPYDLQRYKRWDPPDPNLVEHSPATPAKEEIEIIKPSEIKRPKFPAYSEQVQKVQQPNFNTSESVGYHGENGEIMKTQQSSNKYTKQDTAHDSRSTQRQRAILSKLRENVFQEEGMSVDEKHQDRFYKEISEMLGQSVKLEVKVKGTKSRAEKHLERKLKAKYQAERKELINAKKGYKYLTKKTKKGSGDDTEYDSV